MEQALRLLDSEILGVSIALRRVDLSLENRRRTGNAVVTEAAEEMRETGLGLKAATITPPGVGCTRAHGSGSSSWEDLPDPEVGEDGEVRAVVMAWRAEQRAGEREPQT